MATPTPTADWRFWRSVKSILRCSPPPPQRCGC